MVENFEFQFDQWVESWEVQQNALVRKREERFRLMFDIVEKSVGKKFTVLDLACGPGSLSGRILDRFPEAKSVAVDYDPVLLTLASNYSGYDHSRLTLIEGDLSDSEWIDALPQIEFDVVLSTTALHWLKSEALKNLYISIYRLLKNGGIFLNGDHIHLRNESQKIEHVLTAIKHSYEETALSGEGVRNWESWWDELRKESILTDLLRVRDNRYPKTDSHSQIVHLETQENYLKNAGFKDYGVVWQDLDNRILMAVKE